MTKIEHGRKIPNEEKDSRENMLILIDKFYRLIADISYQTCFLVITGSWGIEAVTGKRIFHNDIDIQFFYPAGTPISIPNVELCNYEKREDDKKELRWFSHNNLSYPLIEIRLFEYDNLEQISRNDILIQADNWRIPLCYRILGGEGEKKVNVCTKKLEYQIATWGIRLFSDPLNPRRQVLSRDFENWEILISTPYDREEVLKYIITHPQYNGLNPIEEILKNL